MPVQLIVTKEDPLVSVVIPSLDGYRHGNVPKLIEDIKGQTCQNIEIIVVKGEKPCARSHNVGAHQAKGEVIVFFDDDIRLGHNKVVENLIEPLIKDKSIGISGASQLIPPDANWFQKRCISEFTRFQFPVVAEMVESDMATHAAMAIRKQVFMEVGQENENLIYGDDPDLRYRIRQAGYRVVVVAHTWVYHPPPSNLTALLRTTFQRGKGAAYDFYHYPHLIYETPPATTMSFVPKRSFLFRLGRAFLQGLGAVIAGKLIFLSFRIVYGLGYLFGLLREILRLKF